MLLEMQENVAHSGRVIDTWQTYATLASNVSLNPSVDLEKCLQRECLLAQVGADTAENTKNIPT